jgi:flavin-dependent dehydrogenase
MTEPLHFDVAIIGGGLAGLTLSIRLAQKGHSVILFEKNKFPFHKVCGEYISNESKSFLERCGIDLKAMNLPEISRLQVSSPSGKLMSHKLGLGGFGISRYLLDQTLADIAIEKGVKILDDCKVSDLKFREDLFSITSSLGVYTAKVAVGAWGKKSNMDLKLERSVAKKSTDRNYVGIKYHIEYDFPSDLIELHNFCDGYCGISRIENDKVCLCYLSDSENLKKYKGDIKAMEREVLYDNPRLRKYFTEAKFIFAEPLAISNIRIGYKSAVEDHVLMAGDAAGNIAPLSGNGMSMAMRSADRLSELIPFFLKDELKRVDLEKKYEIFWKGSFKKRIGLSALLQKMLKNPALTNATINVLKNVPVLREAIVRSTHGDPF